MSTQVYSQGNTDAGKASQGARHAIASQTLVWGLVALLMLAGAVLRLYDLGTESFWEDEVTMSNVVSSWESVVNETLARRPPTYVFSAYVWVQLFGNSEAAARSLSALMSVLSIGAIFLVGREMFNDRVGLVGAALMAFSGRHILHAQDFRYYAMLVLFTLLSFYFFVRALRQGKSRDWAGYALCSALMYYTHVYGTFVLVAQGVFFLLHWFRYPQRRRPWFLSQVAIVVLISPHLLSFARKILGLGGGAAARGAGERFALEWLTPPTLTEPLRDVVRFLFYGYETAALAAGAVFFVVVLGIYIWRQGGGTWMQAVRALPEQFGYMLGRRGSEIVMLLLWFVLPMLIPFVLSFVYQPMYIDRYVLTASPAFFLLLGVVLVSLRRVFPEWLAVGALVIMIVPSLYTQYYQAPTKQQWRETAAYLEAEAEGDEVIVVPTYDRQTNSVKRAFEWYYDGDRPVCQLIWQRRQEPEIAQRFQECVDGYDRVWVVLSHGYNFPVDAEGLVTYYADAPQPRERVEQVDFHQVSAYLFVPAADTANTTE